MNERPALNIEKRNDPISKKGRRVFEREFLDSICEKINNNVIKSRMRYLLTWYDAKAQKNRHNYNLTRVLSYLFPCIITLISIYSVLFSGKNWPALASATISVVLTFTNHNIDHYRYYENWIRYRRAAEALKRESQFFLNECGSYAATDGDEKRERIFANRIERIVADEIAAWENLQLESNNPRPNATQSKISEHPEAAPLLEDIDIA